jgi:hypothetical protein
MPPRDQRSTVFGVEPAVLALMSNESNCCFRVMPRSGGQFFLKILNPSSCHGADEIRISMNWQDALSSEPDVRVPRVIRTPHGEPFCLVEVEGAPPRICTLEEWIPGRRPGGIPARALTRRLGEASAIFHRHARSYSLPPGSRTRIYRGVLPYSDQTFGNIEHILLFAPDRDPWLTPEACDVFARASGMGAGCYRGALRRAGGPPPDPLRSASVKHQDIPGDYGHTRLRGHLARLPRTGHRNLFVLLQAWTGLGRPP